VGVVFWENTKPPLISSREKGWFGQWNRRKTYPPTLGGNSMLYVISICDFLWISGIVGKAYIVCEGFIY